MNEEVSNKTFWTNPMNEIGLWAGLEGGGALLKKVGVSRLKKATGTAPFREAGLWNKVNEIKEKRATFRGVARAGMNLSKLAKTVGFTGLLIGGYELGKGLSKVATRFKTQDTTASDQYQNSFVDTRAAFTQRQRAIQVIHNSQLSTRAVLGQEASYMHY